jgi:hypothetical protein
LLVISFASTCANRGWLRRKCIHFGFISASFRLHFESFLLNAIEYALHLRHCESDACPKSIPWKLLSYDMSEKSSLSMFLTILTLKLIRTLRTSIRERISLHGILNGSGSRVFRQQVQGIKWSRRDGRPKLDYGVHVEFHRWTFEAILGLPRIRVVVDHRAERAQGVSLTSCLIPHAKALAPAQERRAKNSWDRDAWHQLESSANIRSEGRVCLLAQIGIFEH